MAASVTPGAAAPSAHPPLRPWVHAATGCLAVTLGILPRPWALAAGVLGVFVGWVLFPWTGLDRPLRRAGEPFFGGLRTYPLAVLLLLVWLPPAEAAAAWVMLAWGDPAAALVGRRVPAPRIFGHPKATWAGSSALFLVAWLGGWGMGACVASLGASSGIATGAAPGLGTCAAAAFAATLADMIPLPPDDNLPMAGAAGATLHLLRLPWR